MRLVIKRVLRPGDFGGIISLDLINLSPYISFTMLAKAEAALPQALVKKVLASWEFLAIIILIFLGAVFSAIAISVGLLFGPK